VVKPFQEITRVTVGFGHIGINPAVDPAAGVIDYNFFTVFQAGSGAINGRVDPDKFPVGISGEAISEAVVITGSATGKTVEYPPF
jgi:hypothetical protein